MAIDKQIKRDHIWKIIREKKNFNIVDLHDNTTALMEISSIRTYLKQLAKAGYIEKIGESKSVGENGYGGTVPLIVFEYRLIKDTGIMRPQFDAYGNIKKPSGNQKIWASIKVLKQFDYRDITLSTTASKETVRSYLRALKRADYIRSVQKSTTHRPERFAFMSARDTGPLAPCIRKNGAVYDQNLKKNVWEKVASNEA